MSTGLTPIRRHGGLGNASRALAALTVLLLAGIVVLVLVDRGSTTSNGQGGTGSGVAATQARLLPPLTGVDLAGANDVVVRVGARQSVIVEAVSQMPVDGREAGPCGAGCQEGTRSDGCCDRRTALLGRHGGYLGAMSLGEVVGHH